MRKVVVRLVAGLVALNIVTTLAALVLKRMLRAAGGEDSEEVQLVAILDGVEFQGRSRAFLGGSITTMMGGADIDLTRATLAPEGAELRVVTVLGGTRLLVPEGWRVEIDHTGIAGGCNCPDRLRQAPADAPTLVISAISALGGLDVESRPVRLPLEATETLPHAGFGGSQPHVHPSA